MNVVYQTDPMKEQVYPYVNNFLFAGIQFILNLVTIDLHFSSFFFFLANALERPAYVEGLR